MVVASPSLPGVVLPGSVASTAAVAATVLATIPVVAEASLVVSLTTPSAAATVEEEKETETPATPGRGLHGSPSRSEPKAPEGDMARIDSESPSLAHEIEVVEILSDDEADDVVELSAPSRELAVVR